MDVLVVEATSAGSSSSSSSISLLDDRKEEMAMGVVERGVKEYEMGSIGFER